MGSKKSTTPKKMSKTKNSNTKKLGLGVIGAISLGALYYKLAKNKEIPSIKKEENNKSPVTYKNEPKIQKKEKYIIKNKDVYTKTYGKVTESELKNVRANLRKL
jgi:hypothetical protein